MTTYPDTRGMTNLEYRKARGTDKPFDENPTAWQAIYRACLMEIAAKREAEPVQPKAPGRPIGSKGKPRRVKERKAVSSNGRVLVCCTERRTRK